MKRKRGAVPLAEDKCGVQIDFSVREEQYDKSNTLILPPKKKQKVQKQVKEAKKELSKKQKKRLQKIEEQKQQHDRRKELLARHQELRTTPEISKLLISTHQAQTLGRRKMKKLAASCGNIMNPVEVLKKNKTPNSVRRPKCHQREQNATNEVEEMSESEPLSDADEEKSEDSSVECNSEEPNESSEPLAAVPEQSICTETEAKAPEPKEAGAPEPKEAEAPEPKEAGAPEPKEPAVFVPVHRSPEIQAAREKLPVYSEEQAIVEAVKENALVIIYGATGTGKTTQVPQFLYEAGYTKKGKMIGITEPRRIAAIAMSSRLQVEMNLPDVVSYHVRFQKTVTKQTEIKFMTDGILLKEIRKDVLLTRYSVIIIDEAHERSIFSDVLIGLLSRIVKKRHEKDDPLKVIIMSATLRIDDFTENPNLFKQKPHLIKIESRQYDVILHFNKITPIDYLEAANRKVCRIHNELPPGGILVFLTGEQEVHTLCRRLQKTFPIREESSSVDQKSASQDNKPSCPKKKRQREKGHSFMDTLVVDLDKYSVEQEDDYVEHSDDDDPLVDVTPITAVKANQPLYVLPLYSNLPAAQQAKIFESPPAGARLCVVATNVAETSITVPGLKYVVDTGKVKTRQYEQMGGDISQFVVSWTSKASANQRAGRAGRTEGGHCYRLYSSAVFDNDFIPFNIPDIQRVPVDDILLHMKALGIVRVVHFPFPSAPDRERLKAAERRLVLLGALEDLEKGRLKDIEKWEYSAKVTEAGKAMSRFPVSPRYAKMLLLGKKHNMVPYIVALVSAFTVSDLFMSSNPDKILDNEEQETEQQRREKTLAQSRKSIMLGDAAVLLWIIASHDGTEHKTHFCRKYGVRQKAIKEVKNLRHQLTKEIKRNFLDGESTVDDDEGKLVLPDFDALDSIRTVLACCFIDHIARKVPVEELGEQNRMFKNAYKCLETEELVFIHPGSALFKELPEFVVYKEIIRTSKNYMKAVIAVEPEWLPSIAPNMCSFSIPLESPVPYYSRAEDKIFCSVTSTFGRWNWELPAVVREMSPGPTKYCYFTYFLLNGEIIPFFNQFKSSLLSPPSSLLKSWANIVPRIKLFLVAVTNEYIDSRSALEEIWKERPRYLLAQYLEWLPATKHNEVYIKWPKVKNE